MLIIVPLCYTKGPLEDCEYGYYGTDCRQACGKCSGAFLCDRVTGVCAHGCAPGYHSELCTIGKLSTNFLVPHNYDTWSIFCSSLYQMLYMISAVYFLCIYISTSSILINVSLSLN